MKNDLRLDAMQNPSVKILLSTGLSITSDTEIVILNFLQELPGSPDDFIPVISRIAVTPTHLKAYVKMMSEALEAIDNAKDKLVSARSENVHSSDS